MNVVPKTIIAVAAMEMSRARRDIVQRAMKARIERDVP
jgi:hypothetical protein